jgi:hypothetical protein
MLYTHVAAALVSAGLAFTGGWMVRGWKAGADEVAQMRTDARTALVRAEKVDGAAVAHEGTKAKLQRQDQALDREIERVVEKPVYRNVCLDADGLRVIADALAGTPDPGEPAPAVPDPGTPD